MGIMFFALRSHRTLLIRPTSSNNSLFHSSLFLSPRSATTSCLAVILLAQPTNAGTGKLFDFGLTLPSMALQFLLLTFFLDSTWFGPVGKLLNDRNSRISIRLASIRSGTDRLTHLQRRATPYSTQLVSNLKPYCSTLNALWHLHQHRSFALLRLNSTRNYLSRKTLGSAD